MEKKLFVECRLCSKSFIYSISLILRLTGSLPDTVSILQRRGNGSRGFQEPRRGPGKLDLKSQGNHREWSLQGCIGYEWAV